MKIAYQIVLMLVDIVTTSFENGLIPEDLKRTVISPMLLNKEVK